MDQGQNIKLHIAGKEYALKAATPEMEQAMRLAAEHINRVLSKYNAKFPDKPLEDKLAFVTLNETVGKILLQNKLNAVAAEIGALQVETESYLKGIGE